jgi:hypothetical protein
VTEAIFNDIVAGNTPPPSEFVGYLVGTLQTIRGEVQTVSNSLQQLKQRVAQEENTLIALEGAYNKTVRDCMRWISKGLAAEGPTPEAKNKTKAAPSKKE